MEVKGLRRGRTLWGWLLAFYFSLCVSLRQTHVPYRKNVFLTREKEKKKRKVCAASKSVKRASTWNAV